MSPGALGPSPREGRRRPQYRPVWAEVDLAAIAANTRALLAVVAPAALWVVVKADGYGHGAVPVARAALAAGAGGLAVALVEEGVILREAGIDCPVLLLSEPPAAAMDEVVARRLSPTVYTPGGVEALAKAAASEPGPPPEPVDVHVKVDTGMHRVGVPAEKALAVAQAVDRAPGLRLGGLWTHFAVADDPDDGFTALQTERFEQARGLFGRAGLRPRLVHAANSAGAVAHPAARYDMVRCGISVYGYAAGPKLEGMVPLTPAMSLKARVSQVKTLAAGERISYGLRYTVERSTVVATVPLGYADGVPRRLSAGGGQVLVGGRRCPIAGTVTMDQITVDCGPGADVVPGDEVVLLGEQGGGRITADEWAALLDTISYEVVCGVSARVPRVHR